LVWFYDANSLEVGECGDLGVLGEFPELFFVYGLVFISRSDVCGRELRVDSDAELPDSGLDLGLHLLLALSDEWCLSKLGNLW